MCTDKGGLQETRGLGDLLRFLSRRNWTLKWSPEKSWADKKHFKQPGQETHFNMTQVRLLSRAIFTSPPQNEGSWRGDAALILQQAHHTSGTLDSFESSFTL